MNMNVDDLNARRLTRRALMKGGVALGAFGTVGSAFGEVVNPIGETKIVGEGPIVSLPPKKGPYRIGFSNGFSGNSWRAMSLAAIKLEAEILKDDVKDLIIVDGQGDINKQVNDIETLTNQGVDAILCIANSSAVAPALREATKAGIVTVPFNLLVDGEDWTTFVGINVENKGKVLGAWLDKALGGKGKIVALGGLPGNSYTAACWKGAQTAFSPGIEVLAFKDAYWAEDRAKVVMADLITAYPEIDGIWSDGAQNTWGASKALLAANRPLVPVTGDDFNGILKMYRQEKPSYPKFDIGLMSEPTWQSAVALVTAVKLLKGEKVAKRQVLVPQLITSANYEKFIRPDLPDGVFVDNSLPDDMLKSIFK
jgi:ribose transport system substrate-binding protein